MSGAQAADLPVKAKAVEYVRICSLYGAGFYYIPGTDTCIKFGGYLRVDLALNGGDYGPFQAGSNAGANRLSNYYVSRSRSDFTIDTRTATEYGVLRTFADMVFSWTTGNYAGSAPSAFDAVGVNVGQTQLGLYHAFIQFAGFTLGRTVSAFDAPWQSYPAGGPTLFRAVPTTSPA
jgi:Porin subfamily.